MLRTLFLVVPAIAIVPLQQVSAQSPHGMKMAAPSQRCRISSARSEAMLSAAYDVFDQSTTDDRSSWRPLLNTGCYRLASNLIEKYLVRNSALLNAEQIRTLHFHCGQTLAMGGEELASIPHFTISRDAELSPEWNAYVDATLAFLRKDRTQLEAAREAYARSSTASSQRLRYIDGFLACFTKSYTEAVMCVRP